MIYGMQPRAEIAHDMNGNNISRTLLCTGESPALQAAVIYHLRLHSIRLCGHSYCIGNEIWRVANILNERTSITILDYWSVSSNGSYPGISLRPDFFFFCNTYFIVRLERDCYMDLNRSVSP